MLFTFLLLKAVETNNKLVQSPGIILWQNGARILSYCEGDIFSYGFGNRKKSRSIVVIPVETTLETKISWMKNGELHPLVSANTLHGQWLHRWELAGNDVRSIANQIRERFRAYHFPEETDADGKYRVPIGTVIEVNASNARYYLLPISEFDSRNRANRNSEQIQHAIERLMLYYDMCGQGDIMVIPLCGTGMSRANLSYQESFDLIRTTILNQRQLIQGKILIIATPEAYEQIDIGGKQN